MKHDCVTLSPDEIGAKGLGAGASCLCPLLTEILRHPDKVGTPQNEMTKQP